jgi:hypothetical protein
MATKGEIVTILGGWTVIASTILYFLSSRLVERLNIKWKETADKNIAKLQSELARNNNTLNSLITLFGSNYQQAQERRIKAIDVLWSGLNELKKILPDIGFIIYNVLTDEEISEYFNRIAKQQTIETNTFIRANEDDNFSQVISKSEVLNLERPFLGETIWFQFELYKTFVTRISYKLIASVKNRQFEHWHKDSFLKQLLQNSLSQEEFSYIYSQKVSSLKITMAFLENKLLAEINKTLSGETFTETVLERFKKIEELIVKESK